MAVKDIKAYYDSVCADYKEMLTELKDFEEECKKGLVEPERIDRIKESIKPLKQNYETLSWIIFLLNKPARKSKHKKYEQQNKKLLSQLDASRSKEGVLKENKDSINNLKKIIS